MVYHNRKRFSTTDNGRKCAIVYKGGWWYGSCHTSNLNGLYLNGSFTQYAPFLFYYRRQYGGA